MFQFNYFFNLTQGISGVKQSISSSTASSSTASTTTVSYPTCSFEQDIDYFGNDLSSNPTYAASKDACCAQCQANADCQIWVYVTSTTACWLKRQGWDFCVN